MKYTGVFGLSRVLIFLAALLGSGCSLAETPEKEIKLLIRNYFSAWSAADMKGYGQLFHPSASVHFLDSRNRPNSHYLTRFLALQAEFHSKTKVPAKEIPTGIRVTSNDRVARAEVDWELTVGTKRTTGVDYFTLIRTPEGWRILNLVFYEF